MVDREEYFMLHNPRVRETVLRWREKQAMEQEIKDFVLKSLEDAYGFAVDALRRGMQEQSRFPYNHDNNDYVARQAKRVETAKKALAYFGVYR
jgi:hypothetical protein